MPDKIRKLSIIIPVFNEEKTLNQIVEKVNKVNFGRFKTELIMVNDSSTDKSGQVMDILAKKFNNIRVFHASVNMGKGASIRSGLKHVTGEYITIQDADLEYNPEDIKKLLDYLLKNKADVVYGSRFLGKKNVFRTASHYWGNKFLSLLTSLLYGKRISDMETCYKLMKREVAKKLSLKSNKFDIEPEITAKILRQNIKILEHPISYDSRSFAEGKKISWIDGIPAVWTLIKYRFVK